MRREVKEETGFNYEDKVISLGSPIETKKKIIRAFLLFVDTVPKLTTTQEISEFKWISWEDFSKISSAAALHKNSAKIVQEYHLPSMIEAELKKKLQH